MENTPTRPRPTELYLRHAQDPAKEVKLLDEELLIRKTFETDPGLGCEILFRKYYHLLCSHDNFTGANVTLTADNSCLVNNGWNDMVTQ